MTSINILNRRGSAFICKNVNAIRPFSTNIKLWNNKSTLCCCSSKGQVNKVISSLNFNRNDRFGNQRKIKFFSRHFCTTSILGRDSIISGDENDDGQVLISNPFAREFGSFEKVVPANVSQVFRKIPDNIEKPDYWKTGHPGVRLERRKPEIKSKEVIEKMKKACALARQVLDTAMKAAKPGVTTQDIDDVVFNYTISKGAYPSPLNYKKFPKSVCTSVNNVACHGIPDSRPLVSGDIINIDVMVYLDGYHGDCSDTVLVGEVDEKGRQLVEATKQCLEAGISVCGPGVSFSKIGQTIEALADELGFTVVPCFTGHGIGREIHCLPDIYHIDYPYPGKMQQGQTFTIEPVLTQGMEDVVILEDGWTAVTLDGSRTAQSEHTVLVTENSVEILT